MRNVGKTCGGKLITNSSCRTSSHIVEPNNPKLDARINFVEANPRVLVPGVFDEEAHHLPRLLDLNYSQHNSTEKVFSSEFLLHHIDRLASQSNCSADT